MEKDLKDVLFKDLCARLPYGVKVLVDNKTWCDFDGHTPSKLTFENSYRLLYVGTNLGYVKPYLFPLSSMTEEQKKDIFCNGTFFISNRNELGRFPKHSDDYDYVTIDDYLMIYKKLIEKHFDVNGLIPKGLAIDATGLNIY